MEMRRSFLRRKVGCSTTRVSRKEATSTRALLPTPREGGSERKYRIADALGTCAQWTGWAWMAASAAAEASAPPAALLAVALGTATRSLARTRLREEERKVLRDESEERLVRLLDIVGKEARAARGAALAAARAVEDMSSNPIESKPTYEEWKRTKIHEEERWDGLRAFLDARLSLLEEAVEESSMHREEDVREAVAYAVAQANARVLPPSNSYRFPPRYEGDSKATAMQDWMDGDAFEEEEPSGSEASISMEWNEDWNEPPRTEADRSIETIPIETWIGPTTGEDEDASAIEGDTSQPVGMDVADEQGVEASSKAVNDMESPSMEEESVREVSWEEAVIESPSAEGHEATESEEEGIDSVPSSTRAVDVSESLEEDKDGGRSSTRGGDVSESLEEDEDGGSSSIRGEDVPESLEDENGGSLSIGDDVKLSSSSEEGDVNGLQEEETRMRSLAGRVKKGLELLRRGRDQSNGASSLLGEADSSLRTSITDLEGVLMDLGISIASSGSQGVELTAEERRLAAVASGNLGNALLARAELQRRLLKVLRDAPPPPPEDYEATVAAELQLLEEIQELLVNAGRSFRQVLQLTATLVGQVDDRKAPQDARKIDGALRALFNWGTALSLRALLALDCIEEADPEEAKEAEGSATQLYFAALEKFERAEQLSKDDMSMAKALRGAAQVLQDLAMLPSWDTRRRTELLKDAMLRLDDAIDLIGKDETLMGAREECALLLQGVRRQT